MADPVSAAILSGAGSALSAYGVIQSAQAQAANLQAQSNAARYNAALQRQQAEQAMALGASKAELQRSQAIQILGKQRAAIAESGGGFAGSTGLLLDQSAANAELDRQNILYEGKLAQIGLNAQAQQSDYSASVAESQIGPTLMAGYIGAASSLINGYSKASSGGGGGGGSSRKGGKF